LTRRRRKPKSSTPIASGSSLEPGASVRASTFARF
jgi:hypothetical protein